MALADFKLRELRYIDHGAAFPTAFTDADAAGWIAATKLRFHAPDVSGLKHKAEADESVQTRAQGRPAPITMLRGGVEMMPFKFRMYLSGGEDNIAASDLAVLLGGCMGGLKSPGAITDAAEALSTTTTIKAVAHGQAVGQVVLVGTRGDARADGRAGVIATVPGADEYTLSMALPVAPNAGDAIKNGHTVYWNEDAERYFSFLLIGAYAGSGAADHPDQLNIIGCSGSFAVGGLAPGERPYVEFTWYVGDWRYEPFASCASLQHAVDGEGGNPAGDRGMGVFTLGDTGVTTRAALAGGAIEIDPGIEYEPIEDKNGINGIAGWHRKQSESGPTISITRYWGGMPGLIDSLEAGTAKQITGAWGHVAEKTFAIHAQRAFLAESPDSVELRRNAAQKLSFRCDGGRATDLATADKRLADTALTLTLI